VSNLAIVSEYHAAYDSVSICLRNGTSVSKLQSPEMYFFYPSVKEANSFPSIDDLGSARIPPPPLNNSASLSLL
jgi:hypothetical protein